MSAQTSTNSLTDTQLSLLSTAAQRADRALVLPDRLKGNAAQKAAEKLVGLGIAEEIRARGAMPAWRRNESGRAMTLRITKRSLKMIAGSDDEPKPKTTKPAPARQPASKALSAATRLDQTKATSVRLHVPSRGEAYRRLHRY